MSKVFVSGLAWIDVSDWDLARIAKVKSGLTLRPRRTSKYQEEDDLAPIELFKQQENLLGVPREYFMRNRTMEHEMTYRVSPGRKWTVVPEMNPEFVPRDDQPAAIEATLSRLVPPFGGIIVQAPTAWGKTVFALEVARRLGVFTAILIDREKLKMQWVERIRAQLPTVRVGLLQQNRFDIDSDIIVCMMDSMDGREIAHAPLYEQAGLIICDEVHRMGARTRVPIIARFNGPYRVGLSAKPHRIDGCDRAFYEHIGPKAYKAEVRRLTARIVRRRTGWYPVRTNTFDPDKISDQRLLS